MEEYKALEMEVIQFENEDVITTSDIYNKGQTPWGSIN